MGLRRSKLHPTDISSGNVDEYISGPLFEVISDVLIERRNEEIFVDPNNIWSFNVSARARKHEKWSALRDKAKLLWGENDAMYCKELSILDSEAEKRIVASSRGFTYVDKVYRKNPKRRTPPRAGSSQGEPRLKRAMKVENRTTTKLESGGWEL